MDSLDGMPEFGPEEDRVPLVVPDQSGPVEYDPADTLPVILPFTKCHGINIDGTICGRKINIQKEFCIAHDPTPDAALQVFWRRIQSFVQNCEECGPASAQEILTLSAAYKTLAVLFDRKVPVAQKEELIKKVRFVKVS